MKSECVLLTSWEFYDQSSVNFYSRLVCFDDWDCLSGVNLVEEISCGLSTSFSLLKRLQMKEINCFPPNRRKIKEKPNVLLISPLEYAQNEIQAEIAWQSWQEASCSELEDLAMFHNLIAEGPTRKKNWVMAIIRGNKWNCFIANDVGELELERQSFKRRNTETFATKVGNKL